MPRAEPITPIELKGWTGGLNRQADPYQLEDTEVPDCLNVDFGLRGSVAKRRGYTSYATDTETMRKILEWSGQIVMIENDSGINYLVGATVTDSTQALAAFTNGRDYATPHAAMNDFLYLTQHAATTPVRWDETTWTTVTATDFDGTAARFPRARALVAAHDRIFAFNVQDSTASNIWPSRMHYSNALVPETWGALDWIDFAPDDGTEITGAVLFGEQIIVFKEKSMFALAGTDEETFTVYPVDAELGTQAPGTITNVGPELYFFDHLTGVHSFDGSGFKRKDDKINTYLLDGINDAFIYKAVGFAFRGRWFLSVPWGASTTNDRTFVYDPRIDAWTEYDYGFASADLSGITPLAVGVNQATGVHQLFNGNDDAGANIAAHMKTGWLAPDTPSVKHRIRRLDLAVTGLGAWSMNITMRRDFLQDTYKSKSITLDPGGTLYNAGSYGTGTYGVGADQVLSRTTGWGDRWRVCQFEFSENTNGDFQVNRMVMQTSSQRRTRGAY